MDTLGWLFQSYGWSGIEMMKLLKLRIKIGHLIKLTVSRILTYTRYLVIYNQKTTKKWHHMHCLLGTLGATGYDTERSISSQKNRFD